MKLSRKWLHEAFFDISHISDRDFFQRMSAFGHKLRAVPAEDDSVFEFDNPEDRPDLASMNGLVREISAAFQIPYHRSEPEVMGCEQYSIYDMLDAEIWTEELCNRFSCRVLINVNIGPSPDWLQNRLLACGITPVNCVVDAANYTELEYGQKITLLNYECISSGSIWVREAYPGENESPFPILSDGMTPVACGDSVIHPDAEIRQDTTNVIAIAADYSASSWDPMQTVPALQRFCQLTEQLQCADVADGIIDLLNFVPQPRTLPFDVSAINKILGFELSPDKMIRYLKLLEIEVTEQEIRIPSFRPDLNTDEDIAAEIKRIHTICEL